MIFLVLRAFEQLSSHQIHVLLLFGLGAETPFNLPLKVRASDSKERKDA
jgi:hypothetical protein